MTNLIFVRHGESLANKDDVCIGHTDLDLSETGKIQAELTAEYIIKNFKVDKIYSSDLKRAYNTAKAVADKLGIPVIAEQNLREVYFGQWEYRKIQDLIDNEEGFKFWKSDISKTKCPGGEPVAHMYDRILAAVEKIAKENDGKTVLIASHATPIRAIQCACEGKTMEHMKNISWVSNASVSTATYQDGKFTIIEFSQDSHLGGLVTNLPSRV